MADRVSLAIRQEQAINRLEAAIAALAGKSGLELPVIPRRGNDAEMLRALQLEAIAESIETVTENIQTAEVETDTEPASAEAVEVETSEDSEVIDYDAMTKAELVLEARGRNIDVSSLRTRAELIDALQAADGMSEDEQAALDSDNTDDTAKG